jgi:hypothetical protein
LGCGAHRDRRQSIDVVRLHRPLRLHRIAPSKPRLGPSRSRRTGESLTRRDSHRHSTVWLLYASVRPRALCLPERCSFRSSEQRHPDKSQPPAEPGQRAEWGSEFTVVQPTERKGTQSEAPNSTHLPRCCRRAWGWLNLARRVPAASLCRASRPVSPVLMRLRFAPSRQQHVRRHSPPFHPTTTHLHTHTSNQLVFNSSRLFSVRFPLLPLPPP